MRSFTVHPASLALGLLLGGIALLSMSQAIVTTSPIRIEYAPHPREMVQIRGGVPYTVPLGKLLVITALGTGADLAQNGNAQLLVNGQAEAISSVNGPHPLPLGFTATGGAGIDAEARRRGLVSRETSRPS